MTTFIPFHSTPSCNHLSSESPGSFRFSFSQSDWGRQNNTLLDHLRCSHNNTSSTNSRPPPPITRRSNRAPVLGDNSCYRALYIIHLCKQGITVMPSPCLLFRLLASGVHDVGISSSSPVSINCRHALNVLSTLSVSLTITCRGPSRTIR